MIGVNWIWLALLPVLLVPREPLLIGVICGASAFVGPLWNVVIGAYTLTLVPGHLLGRVRSVGLLISWGVMPLGSLVGGLLLQWYGPSGAIWSLAALMLAIALAGALSPAVRHAPPLPD